MKPLILSVCVFIATNQLMSKPLNYHGFEAHKNLFKKHGLITQQRVDYFIAQMSHETDGFKVTEEYASGKKYEFKKTLCNTKKGDGVKYKGRGYIQLTGKCNYRLASEALGIDFVNNPTLVSRQPYALAVSLWYWDKHNLNELADKGSYKEIGRVINGKTKDYTKRIKHLQKVQNDFK